MNKARRQELKKLKFKRRLIMRKIAPHSILNNPKGERYNYTGFINHGQPCNCDMCQRPDLKYNRAKEKRRQVAPGLTHYNDLAQDAIADIGAKYALSWYGLTPIKKII